MISSKAKKRAIVVVALLLGVAVCLVAYFDSPLSAMSAVSNGQNEVLNSRTEPSYVPTAPTDSQTTLSTERHYVLPPEATGTMPAGSKSAGTDTTEADTNDTGSTPKYTSKSSFSGVVNINTATSEDLQQLKGIGPVIAGSIIDYRETHGGFSSIEEILQVKGIGEKRFADIRDFITV